MTEACIHDYAMVRQFVFAGNATFTLKSLKTGRHYTYRVTPMEETPTCFFVRFHSANDRWLYLGLIKEGSLILTRKSSQNAESPISKALDWFLERLKAHERMPDLEFWHAGKCGRCGRQLTDPKSIASGFGPECQAIIGGLS